MIFKKKFNGHKVNILGTDYMISVSSREDDPKLKDVDGYIDTTTKKIVIFDFDLEKSFDSMDDLLCVYKKVLRHEMVHAFFYESGLAENSFFADNETCVDWIALQAPKMCDMWKEMEIL